MPTSNLDCYQFGRQLLKLNDLDPVYVVLWNARLDPPVLRRWLLAYWCFYHVGTASWVTDQRGYWKAMETAAGSKNWPRSSERRHFRGGQAARSVAWLQNRGVEVLFDGLPNGRLAVPAREVIAYVKTWYGFGSWVAFKVADMLERLGLAAVEFDPDTVLYDSPREAATLLYERENGIKDVHGESGRWALGRVLEELNPYPAPPGGDRLLNVQEAETVLCKWKSYLGGHYTPGEDVEATHNGLLRFDCPTARRLLAAGRKGGFKW